jgi:hypothetical protein
MTFGERPSGGGTYCVASSVGTAAASATKHFAIYIVARMRDAEYQPPGMKHVIDQILADPW